MPVIWSNWNHEPMDHLLRMGDSHVSVFTLGEWLPQWYGRLYGEELIAKAAGMGINTVYTHFFKGFGLVHEHDEMEGMREFVQIAHRYGVRVIGYCQLGSLYYETMLDEVPELEDWAARDEAGGYLYYANARQHYYRWRPCLENPDFLAYFKRVIAYGAEHVGLDGFHFDNSQVRECYCPRCQAAFRAYLTENVPNPRELCGLAHFNHVRIPPMLENEEVHDPLCLWRARFRHAQLARAQKEIFDYVKTFGKDVLHNPGLLRPDFSKSGDPALTPASCDFTFAENDRFIRVEDGKTITQILSFKLGQRFGFRLFDAPWMHKDGQTIIPQDADTIARFLAQGMIYGGITGAPWFVRSRKTGDRVILDDPVQYDTAKRAFDYFKAHEALYTGTAAPRARLLYAVDTFYGWPAGGYASFKAAAALLEDSAVPYAVITCDDLKSLAPGETVVLPDMRFASAAQYACLADAARRGVRLVKRGEYGLCNETGKERDHADPIRNLRALPNVFTALPEDLRIPVEPSDGRPILTETTVCAGGRLVLHLLRPDNTRPADAAVKLWDARIRPGMEVKLYSMDEGCALTGCEVTEGEARLRITGLHTMASVAFE